ncbi:ATP-binding protein [Actinoplanes regularis]|uniref:ATP-binding protein n=1 Tax=Actinoplanes regularis TaxID=52697 RepID=UPI0024A4AB05|nr:ATP-binding protein [Actinoplanes regularis]GLW30586.1 hypothetical protein Areg01_35260 [Actinoplanes regularis]
MNLRARRPRKGSGTIGRLLGRAFGGLVGLVLLMGVVGLVATVSTFVAVSQPMRETLRAQAATAEVRSLIGNGQMGLNSYLLSGDETYRDSYESARRAYPAAMAQLRSVAVDQTRALVADLNVEAAQWWALADRQIAGMPGARPPAPARWARQAQLARAQSAGRALDQALSARIGRLNHRNDVLNTIALIVVAVTTVGAVLFGLWIGRSATRRITTPLAQVLETADRLRRGEHDARVPRAEAPAEIEAVAAAVNANADEADTERRMFDTFREHSAAIRQHLSRGDALAAAARGLGDLLDADHVVIRLAPDQDRPAAAEVWSAEGAPGDTTALAEAPVDWARLRPGKAVIRDLEGVSAGAGSVVEVTFGEGQEAVGRLTVVKRQGRDPWRPYEEHLVSMLAADLARALTQAKLFEQAHELVARSQEVDAAKTEFLYTVSHELRTPLTSVSGYLEVLVDQDAGPLNPTQERMLGVIEHNVGRLRLLIEDLLLVSRIEAGRFAVDEETLDLTAMLHAAYAAIQPAAQQAGVTMTCEIDESITMPGDQDHLNRAIRNVFSNAVKFTPSGGTVNVAAHVDGPCAVIVVRDTGIGIPADDLPKLFSRFFRAANATRRALPGTGLGLSIVSAVVQRHGGTVAVDSEEDVGTTVTIRLPLTAVAHNTGTPERQAGVHEYSQ